VKFCGVTAKYFNPDAVDAIHECVSGIACNNNGFLPLADCVKKVAKTENPTFDPILGNMKVCDELMPALVCIDKPDWLPKIEEACRAMAIVGTAESMAKVMTCIDVKCEDLFQCVMQSNCFLGTLMFSEPGPPPPPD